MFRRAAPTMIYLHGTPWCHRQKRTLRKPEKESCLLVSGLTETPAIPFKDIHMTEQESSNKVDKESIALL